MWELYGAADNQFFYELLGSFWVYHLNRWYFVSYEIAAHLDHHNDTDISVVVLTRWLDSEQRDRERQRAVSIFSWSIEQNARDTQMTTRVTEGARWERHDKERLSVFLLGLPPSFLASRGFAAQRSRARALSLLKSSVWFSCFQSNSQNNNNRTLSKE